MLGKIELVPGAIPEILVSSSLTKTLTVGDRYGLMAAVLTDTLPQEEQFAVNRMLRAVRRGRLSI